MARSTLSVRLLQRIHTTARPSAALRNLLLGIVFVMSSVLTGCSSGGDSGGVSSDGGPSGGSNGGAVPSGGASANLAWDPVAGVMGYYIHYGTQSPNSPGSCAYDQATFTSTPTVTVTGLAEGTTYYFAVSAFNGLESTCSAEVSTVTGSA